MKKVRRFAIVCFTLSLLCNVLGLAAWAAPMLMPAEGTVNECLSVGGASSIFNVIKAATCPVFQSRFGISPPACDGIQDSWVRRVPLTECPSGWRASTFGSFPGDWQPMP